MTTTTEQDQILEKLLIDTGRLRDYCSQLENETDEARAQRDYAQRELTQKSLTHDEWDTLRDVIAYAINAADELIKTNYPGLVDLGNERKAECQKAFDLTRRIGYQQEVL